MTSLKTTGNYDKAFPQITGGLHRLADRMASAAGIAVHQPQAAENDIYTRIADSFSRVTSMLNGGKAEEIDHSRQWRLKAAPRQCLDCGCDMTWEEWYPEMLCETCKQCIDSALTDEGLEYPDECY